jgi:hypothetical protein
MKRVDFFVERASTHSTLHFLQWVEEVGHYLPGYVSVGIGGVRRAQGIRRDVMEKWKSEGFIVKGCNYLGVLRDDLFESHYEPGAKVTDRKELYSLYKSGNLFYIDGNLQSMNEFENLPMRFLYERAEGGRLEVAVRKTNVEA